MSQERWIRLQGVEPLYHPRLAETLDEFKSHRDCRFVHTNQRGVAIRPPVTATKDDAEFFVERAKFDTEIRHFEAPVPGIVPGPTWRVSRGSDKLVCLAPGGEGIIFDENGLFKNGGFLNTIRKFPDWLRKEAEGYFVDMNFLSRLPKLRDSRI